MSKKLYIELGAEEENYKWIEIYDASVPEDEQSEYNILFDDTSAATLEELKAKFMIECPFPASDFGVNTLEEVWAQAEICR